MKFVAQVSDIDCQIVVCEMHTFRKCGVHFVVEAHFVAHMCEVSPMRTALANDGEGLSETEVREMLFLPQCVDHKQVKPLELLQLRGLYVIHIGNVGE